MIPLSQPVLGSQEAGAVAKVLQSGRLVQGPEVEGFEAGLVIVTGARHCVAVSSGTAALHVAYAALGLEPDDAVFIPSFAWPSAANVAVLMGARVVFVDSSPVTYNIDVTDLEEKIEECEREGRFRPRLVVPVHQFGLMADMASVEAVAQRHNLIVLADGACALGAHQGGRSLVDGVSACTLSFHPRKSITTGEGGAVLTNHADIAEACRRHRNHGQEWSADGRVFKNAGTNYRLTDIAAAIGTVQLGRLGGILDARLEIARHYDTALAEIENLTRPMLTVGHAFQTYMVVAQAGVGERLIRGLQEQDIGASPGSVSAHCQDVFRRSYGYTPEDLPVALRLGSDGVALPLYPGMTHSDVEQVVEAVGRLFREQA